MWWPDNKNPNLPPDHPDQFIQSNNPTDQEPFEFSPGYRPPPPRYNGFGDEFAKRTIGGWQEQWEQVPPSLKFLLDCQSLVLPPLGIPALIDAAGNLYLDPSVENAIKTGVSGCGVLVPDELGKACTAVGIGDDLEM